eukprot:2721695-Prymnesium_polylepis.3
MADDSSIHKFITDHAGQAATRLDDITVDTGIHCALDEGRCRGMSSRSYVLNTYSTYSKRPPKG